jgi:hypothetical protein
MEHRELDVASARGLGLEPFEHDALGAPGRERRDQRARHLARVANRQQARDRPDDEPLRHAPQ